MDSKDILQKLVVEMVDNGSVTIKLGTPESKALIAAALGKKK
jgi:hypothetical protein